ETIAPEDAELIECETPGLIYEDIYYRFDEKLTRKHLRSLIPIRDMTIPEPLFGTFVEHALPQLRLFAEVDTHDLSNHFTTLPFEGKPEAICNLSFLNGELEASLLFRYGERVVPYSLKESDYEHVVSFTGREGITARNLTEERELAEELFCEFLFNPETHVYCTKTDKKIIDFMTLVIPRFRDRVRFNCPRNLLDRFIYESTEFTVTLSETPQPSNYEIALEVKGPLQGVRVDCMWDRIVSGRSYLEKEGGEGMPKTVLAFDLKEMNEVIRLFDEMGIEKLENMTVKRALWSLANIDEKSFEGLPVTFRMTRRLRDIRKQMLGEKQLTFSPVPEKIRATLRNYQIEGIRWLERLRFMYLSGILADDMGLGKTVQALVAITQHLARATEPALVVCPTSLVYNWKEECHKFNPDLRVLVIDGMPAQRKRLIENAMRYDVVITSYSLLQKDIEPYESIRFSYMILDEAQHIKNRGTRNAKSVKRIKAQHRLVLSGTPIENALEELWSLFDFLMPGFLGSYERFVERYLRSVGKEQVKHLTYLRKKVAPFILRRMKEDVLDEVPPLSENIYHTQLTGTQKELYRSYAKSARDELVKLVERDGFDKVQIHVLATLTRLKQICCHPAIFAKERAEPGDSAKYDMLLELLETLIEGNHKSVIFSQYTKMLRIMQTDFERLGIRFAYLDGASKDRLETVKRFNEDPAISVFLVSLKAGGTGLNLVGADTVIHYDMWWNPAVENQATDRVYRIGQKEKVSVYKLVTLDTIEEKIVEMQNKKKGIVKKIVSCDDEAVTKLTWEDVLELLRT
ncbi:MAG: SNF2-related protein, partial [Simkaniaceae bacterium]|nr:SNF2-related protein [Simkaniaceae bacterium]